MSDIENRLRASMSFGVLDGSAEERGILGAQIEEAIRELVRLRSEVKRLTRERDEVRAELARRNREEGAYQQSVVDALRLDNLPHRRSGSHLDTPDRIRWLIEQRDAAWAVVALLLGEPTSKPVDGDPMDGIAWVRQQETDRHQQREAGRWADMTQRATERADELARLRGALEALTDQTGSLLSELEYQQVSCPLCGEDPGEGEDSLCVVIRDLGETAANARAALAKAKGET